MYNNISMEEKIEKMSDKVIIRRFPDSYAVVGPQVVVKDMSEALEWLAGSGFMRDWVKGQIYDALMRGEEFRNVKRISEGWRGREDGVVSIYKIATKEEVLNYVDSSAFAEVTGHKVTKRAQETVYYLRYHEDLDRVMAYDLLPRQAKVTLDLLAECKESDGSDRKSFSEAAISVILNEPKARERLKTTQPSMSIFNYYKKRLLEEGHLEEKEEREEQ